MTRSRLRGRGTMGFEAVSVLSGDGFGRFLWLQCRRNSFRESLISLDHDRLLAIQPTRISAVPRTDTRVALVALVHQNSPLQIPIKKYYQSSPVQQIETGSAGRSAAR